MLTKKTVFDGVQLSADKLLRLPVEVHCHGFRGVDFSDFSAFDLDALDRQCAREGVLAVPTLYLHWDQLEAFERMMRSYARRRLDGELLHVVGVALEGPLLASHGGTPKATVWPPTLGEWERLAALGEYGLMYTVLSPDAFTPESGLYGAISAQSPRFETIIPLLVERGVRPALGHFTRTDPDRSAGMVTELIDMSWSVNWGGVGRRMTTDHLFNDMPLRIRHAFRTTRARAQRAALLESYDLDGWTLGNIEEILGPVPAAIMRAANAGRISACINFDGEHVDLAIAKRAVELMGLGNSMIMTDRCDSARLGGQALEQMGENSLWYQGDGIVAAGSQPLAQQFGNARSAGFADDQIWQLVADTAHQTFGLSPLAGGGAE